MLKHLLGGGQKERESHTMSGPVEPWRNKPPYPESGLSAGGRAE